MASYAELKSPASAKDGDDVNEPVDLQEPTTTAPSGDANTVPLRELFSYADATDKLLMAVGTLGAFAAGITQPIQIVLLGDVLNSFNPTGDVAELADSVNDVVLNLVYVGVAAFFCAFFQVACWSLTAARQAKRIRREFVKAVLSKEIGWFDLNDPMQIPTRVADATTTIQEGMGRRLADGLHFVAMAVGGLVIGLVKGWELALVLLAFTPFIAATAFVCMKAMQSATFSGMESYSKAGAIAQEALDNVRTVHSLNAVAYFVDRYEEEVLAATKAGIRKGFTVGWGTGMMYFVVFCTYAGGMFYGAVKVADDQLDGQSCVGPSCYDGGRVVVVFFSMINGAMVFGRAGPSVEAISSAKVAAFEVFRTIKTPSTIDSLSDGGKVLDKVSGRIQLENVTFAYPSRPDIQVCSNYSLAIEAGETIALVGPSGSGKSTVVSLLERFYDPSSGSVTLDGADLRTLNIKWLRQQIGLVGQEPVLFDTSILENIRHGAPSATDDQVVEAAKVAQAFEFITGFPEGFNTEVGAQGTQLSGGQKQRIAIARAVVKDPPILILDEATSALDTESERVVQESLERLVSRSKRTTIVIAHNLATIRDADRIAVHSRGAIVEIGTHDQLMDIRDGHYRKLVGERLKPTEERVISTISSEELEIAAPSTQTVSDGQQDADTLDGGKLKAVSTARIWKLSLPDWRFLSVGAVGAIANAAVFPVWGLVFTKITMLLYAYTETRHEMLRDARYWALGFVGLGVVFGISATLQNLGFAVVSQRLIARVRRLTFSAMLRQDIAWFDMPPNAPGALTSQLATDSATLHSMTSEALNHGLVNLTTVGIAMGISLFHSWQMTAVMLATCPILVLAFYIQGQQMSGAAAHKNSNDADVAAASLLHESVASIRTVASLGLEKQIVARYTRSLEASNAIDRRAGIAGGLSFGLSLGMTFLFFAFLFYIAGKWVDNNTVEFEDAFVVLMVIMLSMFAVGMTAQDATAAATSKSAAQRFFHIVDRVPEIDACSSSGQTLPQVEGDVTFNRLTFAYPSRAAVEIYREFTLTIAKGQTVALVGASGSGKSTAIALLERFYDPSDGVVTLDGTDLRQLNVVWLRDRIALVGQEPMLFSGSIAQNIALAKPGATRGEVVEAARSANAFDFISSFPDGFDTDVGESGAQVSGGQKQRIAIARAILRDADVLLLDEATSALDAESERMVQASLDRLLLEGRRRTTIVVAHRLSTIRHADIIAVVDGARIVEQGTHEQLMMNPNGAYRALVARQMQ